MGLDVYLYTAEQETATLEHERAWDELYAKKESGEITQEEYDKRRVELPSWEGNTDVPAVVNPEHLCNRRYLRSSYNEGGFNSWAPKATGNAEASFYGIFEPILRGRDEEYNIKLTAEDLPALAEVVERASKVAAWIRGSDLMQVTTVNASTISASSDHMWSEPPTAAQALEWWREEKAKDTKFGSYTTAKGLFLDTPLDVRGVVIGKNILGDPAAHLIYQTGEETSRHYEDTAIICAEFAAEATTLIEQDGFCHIHWSG